MTLREIQAEVKRLDPNVREDDFPAAVLLLSSLVVGADPLRLAAFTGYKLKFIRTVDRRLRAAGIWRGEAVHADWSDPEGGGISFWIDVCVAGGFIRRGKAKG